MNSDLPTFKIAINKQKFVEKPAELNWDKFNDGFHNWELDIMRFCNAIYLGFPYCPWMDGRRKVENFQLAQHIAVDMDCGDGRADIEALTHHPLVQTYGAIIHETPSHKPDAPRSRVIFILDEPIQDAHGYKVAIQTVTDMFDGSDPACVDAARFFYGNGKLNMLGRTEGIWFNPEVRLPLAELRRFARLRSEKQKEQRNQTASVNTQSSDETMSLREMEDKLRNLNPYAMHYTEWAKVVAALGHVYGFSAFAVAKRWGDKPGKDPLTEKKWRSLIAEHPKAAGYGTIMRALKEFG